jgi:hypothetical protein
MKKITLFLFSILALVSVSKAQTPVKAIDFTNNPEKYKGMTISISGVELNTKVTKSVTKVASGSTVSTGKGAPAPSANTLHCKAPKGYSVATVNFPNDPSFKKCFIMKTSVYATLPINQSAIKSTITFKGESKINYTITLFKL